MSEKISHLTRRSLILQEQKFRQQEFSDLVYLIENCISTPECCIEVVFDYEHSKEQSKWYLVSTHLERLFETNALLVLHRDRGWSIEAESGMKLFEEFAVDLYALAKNNNINLQ